MNPSDVHILVIDDEASNRLLISRQLQRDGYPVATASSGAEGLEYLDHQWVNVIFLDLIMPGLSGYQVLAHLRADPSLASISVVIVSAIDDLNNIIRCLDMGADDYILKPVNPLLLKVRLHTCLERQWLRQQEQAYLQQLRRERDLAEAANRARSTFLANMSHELRTPLNAVIGYTEILQEELTADGLTDYLDDLTRIRDSSQHLLGLINDVLDMSKLESGTMDLDLDTFTIGEVLAQLQSEMRLCVQATAVVPSTGEAVFSSPTTPCKTLVLDLRVSPQTSLHSDRQKLQQILGNVVGNALKFTPQGTVRLSIALEPRPSEADELVITIEDTGIGISPEQQERLFEPFTQGDDSTTRPYGGSGLGLAICHRLSQMLGGSIQVDSVVNQGTTVTLRLPIHWTPAEAIAASDARLRSPGGQAASGERDPRLVLVIDSDRAVRDGLVQHINRAGYRVVASWSGADGVRLARDLHPALILLSGTLPGISSWSTLAALKADPALMDSPVVLHGLRSSSAADGLYGALLGPCHCLTKPDHYPHILTLLMPYGASVPPPDAPAVAIVQAEQVTQHLLQRLLLRHQWTVQTVTLEDATAHVDSAPPRAMILDLSTLTENIAAWSALQAQRHRRSASTAALIPMIYTLTPPLLPMPNDPQPSVAVATLSQRLNALIDEALEQQFDPCQLQPYLNAYCMPAQRG